MTTAAEYNEMMHEALKADYTSIQAKSAAQNEALTEMLLQNQGLKKDLTGMTEAKNEAMAEVHRLREIVKNYMAANESAKEFEALYASSVRRENELLEQNKRLIQRIDDHIESKQH